MSDMPKFVPLYRVSTDGQAESGLGLLAQKRDVAAYVRQTGGYILASYEETESGKHYDVDDRPVLLKAARHAKRSGATLVIAKTDRLIRSVPVLAYLKNLGVRFIALDNPTANEFTTDILVAVAANEARDISKRTTNGLREYREHKMLPKRIRARYPNGVPPEVAEQYAGIAGKLGGQLPQCRTLTLEATRKGAAAAAVKRSKDFADAYADLRPEFERLHASGMSLMAIAAEMNAQGQTTRTGAPWTHTQVGRVLRHGAAPTRTAPEMHDA